MLTENEFQEKFQWNGSLRTIDWRQKALLHSFVMGFARNINSNNDYLVLKVRMKVKNLFISKREMLSYWKKNILKKNPRNVEIIIKFKFLFKNALVHDKSIVLNIFKSKSIICDLTMNHIHLYMCKIYRFSYSTFQGSNKLFHIFMKVKHFSENTV